METDEASNRSQLFPRYKTMKNVGIKLTPKDKYNSNKLQVLKNTINTYKTTLKTNT